MPGMRRQNRVVNMQTEEKKESSYIVYILRCGDESLYTGITNDLDHRVAVHNSGKGGKYTRSHLPVTPVYWETAPDKPTALRRELEIKALSRAKKLELIGTFSEEKRPIE